MSIFDQSHPRGAHPTIDQREVRRRWAPGLLALCVAAAGLTALGPVQADKNGSAGAVSAAIALTLTIDSASWSSKDARLRVSGKGTTGSRVTLVNAYAPSQTLGTNDPGSTGSWSISKSRPSPVPCRVRAVQANGQTAERTVSNAPTSCSPKAPVNAAPTAKSNGPYSGTAGTAISFSSAGSTDLDGSIVAYAWTFGDGATATTANPTHAYAAAGTYTVSLTVTDNLGKTSALSSTTAAITALVACNSSIPEHCSITAYTGPAVCVACHEGEARDMHSSVHYQQGGAFPNVTNIPKTFAAAGERPAKAAGDLVATGMNTYCGTHENSPRFTCAGCHVGNGRFPLAQSLFDALPADDQKVELANIDCLMCHQQVYKRFPDWTTSGLGFSNFKLLNLTEDASGHLASSDGNSVLRTGFQGIPNVDPGTGDFQFMPAGLGSLPAAVPMTPMPITTLEAARTVHATTRQSCLNCHAGAAGADGAKRGDLSKENVSPSITLDMHMSPAGADLTCSNCHNATGANGESHRVRGRGLDLRANDVPGRFTCETGGCHSNRPHGDYSATTGSSKDKHAMKVACQTCHIPAYAKAAVGTEIARDWQDPHPSDAACHG
ncbi:MAG TPA: PKD domain-containing protein, partial [Lamprocystis sp. (in: g-proteobacteria)]|nr:PKD domain-containing protein [Lamprocystis sp. (in: g-proteobacteria)]